MEQLSPIPPEAMMKEQKRATLASLKWREGWSRCSIYFVQDCSIPAFSGMRDSRYTVLYLNED